MTDGSVHLQSRPVVRVDRVNHYYGEGEARNQVLFNNCLEIGGGQAAAMIAHRYFDVCLVGLHLDGNF